MDLLLHPTTGYQFEALKNTAPHAVLITGEEGTGKATLAHALAAALIGHKLENYAYFKEVSPEKLTISIESIRELRNFLRRKTTGEGTLRRAVVILDGHTMTTEAQNALLKNLEEPPEDTVIIITANDITKLLPTIRSRAQLLHMLPVSLESAQRYFKSLPQDKLVSAYYMSDGRVGLMQALLTEDSSHPLVEAISEAKELLKMGQYERLAHVDGLSKQKEGLALLLTGFQRILSSGLKQAAEKQNDAQTRSFYHSSQAVYAAQADLARNVNPKLLLTDLFLHL